MKRTRSNSIQFMPMALLFLLGCDPGVDLNGLPDKELSDSGIPSTDNISSIRVAYVDQESGHRRQFVLPSAHWTAVLGELSPAKPDQRPLNWIDQGRLTILTKDGRNLKVYLFNTMKDFGAFRILEASGQSSFYRCPSSLRIFEALQSAYQDVSTSSGSTKPNPRTTRPLN